MTTEEGRGPMGLGLTVHPDLILRPWKHTRGGFEAGECAVIRPPVSQRFLWLVCVEGPFLSPPTDIGREWGSEDRGTPNQVHDDENTFPGHCSGLSPTPGCCQEWLGIGTSKTGSEGNLFNSLQLQAWVSIITQHPSVISCQ